MTSGHLHGAALQQFHRLGGECRLQQQLDCFLPFAPLVVHVGGPAGLPGVLEQLRPAPMMLCQPWGHRLAEVSRIPTLTQRDANLSEPSTEGGATELSKCVVPYLSATSRRASRGECRRCRRTTSAYKEARSKQRMAAGTSPTRSHNPAALLGCPAFSKASAAAASSWSAATLPMFSACNAGVECGGSQFQIQLSPC